MQNEENIQTPEKTDSIALIDRTVEYQAFGSMEKVQLSINIVRKWLASPTKSGKTASDSEVMKFIMLCRARQLNPWEGDAYLIGYDSQSGPSFSLITAHQALLKRSEAHAQFDGMQSGVIVQNADGETQELEGDFLLPGQTLLGGWCVVYRKDTQFPKKARLNLTVFDKGFGQWKSNPAGMIVKCAEADALRGSFPNTLGGMYNDAEMTLLHADKDKSEPSKPGSKVPPAPGVINEDQRTNLFTLAETHGKDLKAVLQSFGFEISAKVTVDKYDEVVNAITDSVDAVAPQEELASLEDYRKTVTEFVFAKIGDDEKDVKKFLGKRDITKMDRPELEALFAELSDI